jgi:hypothetical protein
MVKWLFVLCIGLALWLGSMILGGKSSSLVSGGGFGFTTGSSVGGSAVNLAKRLWR